MKANSFFSLLVLLSLSGGPLYAQSKTWTLTGIVKSFEESFPLGGVTIAVKGNAVISGTQADGIYYITVSEKDSVLIFSLPGYQTQEVKITADKEYNVTLKAANYSSALLPKHPATHYRPLRYSFMLRRCCSLSI